MSRATQVGVQSEMLSESQHHQTAAPKGAALARVQALAKAAMAHGTAAVAACAEKRLQVLGSPCTRECRRPRDQRPSRVAALLLPRAALPRRPFLERNAGRGKVSPTFKNQKYFYKSRLFLFGTIFYLELAGCTSPLTHFCFESTRMSLTLKSNVLSMSSLFSSTKFSARSPENVVGFGPTLSCPGSFAG